MNISEAYVSQFTVMVNTSQATVWFEKASEHWTIVVTKRNFSPAAGFPFSYTVRKPKQPLSLNAKWSTLRLFTP